MTKLYTVMLCKFFGRQPRQKKPVYHNGLTYITNGHYVLRFAGRKEDAVDVTEENRKMAAFMESLFPSDTERAEMRHAPLKIDPTTVTWCEKCRGFGIVRKCEECGGSGEVSFENDYNKYECECQSCYGCGAAAATRTDDGAERCSCCQGFGREVDERYFEQPERIGKARLSPDQILRLSHLPLIAWAAHGIHGHFIFFGGDGVLLGQKTQED